MQVVFVLVFVFVVLVGVPLLCRAVIRRLSVSRGFRQWLNAYGPRFPRLGQNEPPDEGTDG